jgi:hypothetical protein
VPASAPPVDESGFVRYIPIGLAWLIPGSGYFFIGQKARGLVILITIHGLFLLGMLLGGIKSINPSDQPIWAYTQLAVGWPTLVASAIQTRRTAWETEQNLKYDSYNANSPEQRAELQQLVAAHPPTWRFYAPKTQDVGTVYCGIAGMLNILVIFDIFARVSAEPATE